MARSGGPSPSGIDRLIENFDRVAGRSGEMTFEQFKAFAADRGVQLQVAGARPADGTRAPGAAEAAVGGLAERAAEARNAEARQAELKKADAKQTSDAIDVSLLSETELRTMVAKGDHKAVLELERRSEVREESERSVDLPRVDVYA